MTGAVALTVQQPWATAILWGGKDVENRTWSTKRRDRIGIHAGKVYDTYADSTVTHQVTHVLPAHLYVRRGLLGTVEITGCHRAAPGCCTSPWAAAGQWHWQLHAPRPFITPIPCPGRLGLCPVPDDVRAEVHRRMLRQ